MPAKNLLSHFCDPRTLYSTDSVNVQDCSSLYEGLNAYKRWDPTVMLTTIILNLKDVIRYAGFVQHSLAWVDHLEHVRGSSTTSLESSLVHSLLPRVSLLPWIFTNDVMCGMVLLQIFTTNKTSTLTVKHLAVSGDEEEEVEHFMESSILQGWAVLLLGLLHWRRSFRGSAGAVPLVE